MLDLHVGFFRGGCALLPCLLDSRGGGDQLLHCWLVVHLHQPFHFEPDECVQNNLGTKHGNGVRQPARCAAAKHQEEVKQKKYHESDDYDVVHTVQWHISDGAVDEVDEDGRNWFSVRRL